MQSINNYIGWCVELTGSLIGTGNNFNPPMGTGRGGMRMNGPGSLMSAGPRANGPMQEIRNDGMRNSLMESKNDCGPIQSQVTIPTDVSTIHTSYSKGARKEGVRNTTHQTMYC